MDQRVDELQDESEKAGSLSLHAFSDLSHVSPLMFLYLLKESYACGKIHGGALRASAKFRILQQQVLQVLHNAPQPGPAIFVAQVLYISRIFDLYTDGFNYLMISGFRRYLRKGITEEDKQEASVVAAKLFIHSVCHGMVHDEKVLVMILEVFDVRLTDIEKAMQIVDGKADINLDTARKFIEQFISKLIESQSYETAVSLLEQFSFYPKSGESFLLQMLQIKEYRAAEKWATFLGKPMLRVLVEEYIKENLLNPAYNIIKTNDMLHEYPDVCKKYKESSLKKLAEKGCWEVAEDRTKGDRQFLQYLVYLALEAGYLEKVEELCTRYALDGFENINKTEANCKKSSYLHLDDFPIEDVVWVDGLNELQGATSHLEECKVVGLDCEWKPNYEKGSKRNKVSIMQIASEKKVYILDLIKLCESVPASLDECLSRILHSTRILKLGYNFKCDVEQLSQSYPELQCFKQYDMLLDIQNVFKEPKGGLSGLSEKVLGRGLNKTRRNSDWEKRPLSVYQLEYAALDAVVLIEIFRHVRNHVNPTGVTGEHSKVEWKSHIVSHIDRAKGQKKGRREQKAVLY
ncbi:OLC1v1001987C1 [Oldenlandia corymbosa var. corymbosa]|uniref:OLC1v1001987C1 n=1 Tax=Oldenlandia corymbosa var. corymbosa TaxID=529605 RepID=A0AAV1D6K6_OLDCO|nr:OLC1v1001987C1 [Oldenlandia corymbosa var. corymbosa]